MLKILITISTAIALQSCVTFSAPDNINTMQENNYSQPTQIASKFNSRIQQSNAGLTNQIKIAGIGNTTSTQIQPTTLVPTNYNNTRVLLATNYNNANEHKILSQSSEYLLDSFYLINKAEALQHKNARYKFNYPALKNDINEISRSIDRFINQDKESQVPREFNPLTKRY